MKNKNKVTKSIFSSISKLLIVFIVVVGYFLINKSTTYAAAYPYGDKGDFFIYFTDADGTTYGYKIDVNFGAGFTEHNLANQIQGGSNWGAEHISYTARTILGDDSKKPIIGFNYVGNDIPDQTGHFRNVTIYIIIPRTAGASSIEYVKTDNSIYPHPASADQSTSTDIANGWFRTSVTYPIQDLGIKIYGDLESDNGYWMAATGHANVYFKTVYDQYTQEVNHYQYDPSTDTLNYWYTETADITYGQNYTPAANIPDGYRIMRANFNTDINDVVDLVNGYTVHGSNSIDIVYESIPITYYTFDLNSTLNGVTYGNLGSWGTADVWINGSRMADDVTDYYLAAIDKGSTYAVNDIKVKSGFTTTGATSFNGIINSNTSVSPAFLTKTSNVTFNLDGGAMYDVDYRTDIPDGVTFTADIGDASNDFGPPRKTGCTFDGWSLSPYVPNSFSVYQNGGDTWYFEFPSYDVTLTAQWKINDYPVTYVDKVIDTNGALLGTTSIVQKPFGSTVKGSDNGVNDTPGFYYQGYKYTGETTATVTTSGATVYRFFAVSIANYKVNHYLMNLDGSTYAFENSQLLSGTVGSLVTPTFNTYNGFTPKDTTQTVIVKADNSTVVNYYYTRNTYYFDLNSFLDGVDAYSLANEKGIYATVDIYFNGKLYQTEAIDCYTLVYYGSNYELKNIKANAGRQYDGTYSDLSGTITSYNDIRLYFSTITYNISYNYGSVIVANPSSYSIDTPTFTLNNPEIPGLIFDGWFGSNGPTPKKEVTIPKGTIGDLTYTIQYTPIKYNVIYNANGGSGFMNNSMFYYGYKYNLPTNNFTKENAAGKSKFIGWNTNSKAKDATHEENGQIENLSLLDDSIITLYAIWDDKPIITGMDSYYTLDDAINGKIIEADLLKNVIVTDDWDTNFGSLLKVADYNLDEFKQFTSDGSTLIKYQVTDSGGNTSYTTNTVHIVDTTTQVVQENKYVRFISEDYYQKTNMEGGLGTNSIWKTDATYAAILEKAMANRKSLVEEIGTINVFAIHYSYTKPGSISQNHIYQSLLFSPEEIKKVKEYINIHGIGNIWESTALNNFLIEFSNCKK